jgi:hypothetical protein
MPESREKHRDTMRAFWASKDGQTLKKSHAKKARQQMTGVKRSAAAREKMRQAKLGKPHARPRTAEWNAKIAAAQKGKPRRPWTPEERERRMAVMQSPEVRAKMSASAKQRRRRGAGHEEHKEQVAS